LLENDVWIHWAFSAKAANLRVAWQMNMGRVGDSRCLCPWKPVGVA
jgi:hypothetical protein